MDRPAAIERLAAMLMEQESRAREVARLLHDSAGQTLTAVGFHLHALENDKAGTAEIRAHLEQVMDDVRVACNKLQSNVVERSDLKVALEILIRSFEEASDVPVVSRIHLSHRYPKLVGYAVYRVIELALDNVWKHSGTQEVEVCVTGTENGVSAEICDRGRGFDATEIHRCPPGAGLILMESYCQAAGLNLQVASRPEQGTIVKIRTA